MAVTVAEINKLRKMTGAGMMDCKKALVEADGDFEVAIDVLRKKGAAKAAKRADRDAAEGLAITKTTEDGKFGVLLSLNCETDFVAKNADFGAMANTILDLALTNGANTVEELNALSYDGNGTSVADKIAEANGTIGEKIEITEYYAISAESVYGYNHPGNQVASLVAMSKASDETVAKNVAMQIAAMAPVALDAESVPQEIKDREMEIGRDQARQEGKPAEMIDRIAEGKLKRYYKDATLLAQPYIIDNKKSVAQYLKEQDGDLTVTAFKRISLNN